MRIVRFDSWEEAKETFNKSRVYMTLMKVQCLTDRFYDTSNYATTMSAVRFKNGAWKAYVPYSYNYETDYSDDTDLYTANYTPLIKYAFEMNLRG